MSKKEQKKEEAISSPKKKGRKPCEVDRTTSLTKEEEERLKKSEFGRLLKRF